MLGNAGFLFGIVSFSNFDIRSSIFFFGIWDFIFSNFVFSIL